MYLSPCNPQGQLNGYVSVACHCGTLSQVSFNILNAVSEAVLNILARQGV